MDVQRNGPLAGIRVIEWAVFMSGPATGYMLGDLGAEVIKIEHPEHGDNARGLATVFGAAGTLPGDRLVGFETVNRSKKSVAIDVRHPKGREVLRRLVECSDVFLTNFTHRAAEAAGLDYPHLKEVKPMLIYARIDGFGTTGALIDRRAFDNQIQAYSGMMWASGQREFDEPSLSVGAVVDQLSGTILAYGVLAALLARERFGVGQLVESSLLKSVLHQHALNVNTTLWRGRPIRRHSRRSPLNPLSNHYRCKDGNWVLLCEIESDKYWSEICHTLGSSHLENDTRFQDSRSRNENKSDLVGVLDDIFAQKTRDEWVQLFREKQATFAYAPVNTFDDVVQDVDVVSDDGIVDLTHPTMGIIRTVGIPVRLSETPATIQSAAPELGEHTEQVLSDIAGYSWEEITELRATGCIGPKQ